VSIEREINVATSSALKTRASVAFRGFGRSAFVKAARLASHLDRTHVATIDLLMHHGFSQSIGGKVADVFGHIIDQVPRRAAFLHGG
jgi:hypothetical protein